MKISTFFNSRPSKASKQEGFTLVEVAVSTVVLTLFMTTAMQGMVLSTVFKVKAKQLSKVNAWIQQDLEDVIAVASDTTQIPNVYVPLRTDAAEGDTIIQVNQLSGFRVGDAIVIGSNPSSNTITALQVQTDADTNEDYLKVTLRDPLTQNQTADTTATVLARCRSDIDTGGFAAYLDDKLPAVISETNNANTPTSGSKTFSGKQYTLQRATTVRQTKPYQVLEVTYKVIDENQIPVTQVSTEVLPDAFLSCP